MPYSGPQVSDGVGSRLGAGLDAELVVNTPEVVLRSLGANEKPCGDLLVRKALAEEAQHLRFAFTEQAHLSRARATHDAQGTHQRRGGIRLSDGAERIEFVTRSSGNIGRSTRRNFGEYLCKFKTGPC